MTTPNGYVYLEPRTGSRFRQLFVRGRAYTAERLYRETLGEDARSVEEVARDFDLPVEAVLEAIAYCRDHEDLLNRERDEELARIAELEKKRPSMAPPILLGDAGARHK